MRGRVIACSALLALAMATASGAHHSQSMIEISAPLWVKGTVVEFHARDPHVMVKLQAKGADGQLQNWDLEGPNMLRMGRMGADKDFLKPGDVIEACGFHFKQAFPRPVDFIHAHLLVMPDGHMRLFGPYGKLTNCVRPGDATEMWAKFLKEDPLGMQAWCNARLYVASASVTPAATIEAIDRKLENPCH